MSYKKDITDPAKPKTKKKKPQSRFQKLWDEAERLKRTNLELEGSLNELVRRIQSDLAPAEMDMGRSMRLQMDKLIVFAGRKSLPMWQRDVLDSWIISNMETLEAMGLIDDSLRDSIAVLQAQVLGIEIDQDTDQSAVDQLMEAMEGASAERDEQSDHDMSEVLDDDPDFQTWYDEQMSLFEQESEEEHYQSEPGFNDDSEATDRIAPNPQKLFKTLFHRVARVLHPDKETDSVKREEKQALMAQLLEARRHHDLIKVFDLYREHVDASLDFGDDDLKELEDVLLQFIEQESQRLEEIASQSELHHFAFSEFYSKNPATVEKRMKQKLAEIERRNREIQVFSNSVTSLQKLKPYLEARYDAMFRFF